MISFYFSKNSIFEKARKTAKNEENQRKSLVFSPLSIKTATHGGATRNRTGESRICSPLPYRLAMAPYKRFAPFGANRFLWSGLRGSNSLPPPWQGGALPDELRPHILLNGPDEHPRVFIGMVPPVGIEPTTRGFSVPCSTN